MRNVRSDARKCLAAIFAGSFGVFTGSCAGIDRTNARAVLGIGKKGAVLERIFGGSPFCHRMVKALPYGMVNGMAALNVNG